MSVLADVASYRNFLPFIKGSKAVRKPVRPDKVESLSATLRVFYKKLSIDDEFVSDVEIDRANMKITMKSEDGPLKKLDAAWQITPIHGRACKIALTTDVSLRSLTLQFVLVAAMDYIVRKLFNAFEERAVALHEHALT